ncbi:MAG TPA: ABC transporter permease [Candidatus Acidoferrales bacterium]|nr:ABC transporter permease [Candidatus Acidoferrales bacterium]
MGTFWQDLQYGGRLLLKSPAFTLIAVATLALGIGANTAIFGVVNTVILRPLPYPNHQQLVNVWETDSNRKIKHGSVPPGDFFDWRAQNQVFQGISAFQFDVFNLTGAGEPEQVWGGRVSANFLDLLGVKPTVGRTFRPDEEQPGHGQVVIISHGIWVRHFASNPNVIGRTVTIDDKPYTLIGVLPADFNLLGLSRQFEVWVPLEISSSDMRRDNPSLIIFGRLKPDVTIERANSDMDAISRRLSMQYPATNQGVGTNVVSMQELMSRGFGDPLFLLLASVGLVLLIACANVANLLLARAAVREREVAIRSALGAGRLRLVRQLLTESVLLGLIGGAVGLLLAYGGLKMLPAILPPAGGVDEIPRINMTGISGTVFAFTVGIAILTGIIFGLAPAFQFSKTNLTESLKESGRSSTGGVQKRVIRDLLAIVEVGLSLVLLIGAGTLIRSLDGLLNSNPGFNPKNVLSMHIWLPESHHPGGAQTREFFQQIIERMRAVPGVNSASAINFLPLTSWTDYANFDIAGRPSPPPRQEFVAHYRVIDSQYFRTMEVSLIRGRSFTDEDNQNAQGVAIVNQALAGQYWPNQNVVGQRVRIHLQESRSVPWRPAASDAWLTIVGIVADTSERKPGGQSTGLLYLPYLQIPSRMMRIVLRTSGPPDLLASAARQAVQSIDQNQPVTEVQSMERLVSQSISSESLNATLLTFFAALALILAAIGIYGVISYGVEQRTHEIGIRLALGAQPRDVVHLIVRQGIQLALVGIVIGFAAAFGLIRWLSQAMFGIKSIDPGSSAIAVALLFSVAFLACYIPARRATRVDPVQALRYE